jgi:hypothetical protein
MCAAWPSSPIVPGCFGCVLCSKERKGTEGWGEYMSRAARLLGIAKSRKEVFQGKDKGKLVNNIRTGEVSQREKQRGSPNQKP